MVSRGKAALMGSEQGPCKRVSVGLRMLWVQSMRIYYKPDLGEIFKNCLWRRQQQQQQHSDHVIFVRSGEAAIYIFGKLPLVQVVYNSSKLYYI